MCNKPILKIKNLGGLKKSLSGYGLSINDLVKYSLIYLINDNNSFLCFSCENLIYIFG